MSSLKLLIPGVAALMLTSAVIAHEEEATEDTAENATLNQDIAACEMWAYETVGPPPAGEAPESKEGSVVKSTVIGVGTGAAVGAVGGEVVADKAGKGAAVGAIAGGLAGYLKGSKNKKAKEKEADSMADQQETFDNAVLTCMNAKGYE